MTTVTIPRTWTILRHRVRSDVVGLPILFGLFVVAVGVVAGGILLLGDGRFETSVWEQASQFPRWYAGAMGVYLTAIYLPLYIAHGCTRREFARQLPVFVAAFAAALATLMTLGYGLERLVYGAFGWSQTLTHNHLFDTLSQWPLVFAEFLLLLGAWTTVGTMLGAAFYRSAGHGLALLPLALLMVAVVQVAVGPPNLGPLPSFGATGELPLVSALFDGGRLEVAATAAAGVIVVAGALAWSLVRDLPVRSKAA